MKVLGLLAWGAAVVAGASLDARADGSRPVSSAYTPYAYAAYDTVYTGYDWSGIYIGAHAGAAFATSEWRTVGSIAGDLPRIEPTANGFAGGVQIGVQKQWGGTVAGLELSYTALDGEVTSGSNLLGAEVKRSSEVSNLVLVTGRFGFANENLLAYAKGGYASADVDFGIAIGAPVDLAGSSSEREHGWTAGLGLEYAIRDNLILGVEYNYVRLNADTRVLTPAVIPTADGGIDLQSIVARLSFKFGAHPDAGPGVPTK
jgi:outer membrane immunogenic protein